MNGITLSSGSPLEDATRRDQIMQTGLDMLRAQREAAAKRAATTLNLARQSGVSPELATRGQQLSTTALNSPGFRLIDPALMDGIEAKVRAQREQAFLTEASRTADWASNYSNAQVAHDDLETLGAFEGIGSVLTDAWKAFAKRTDAITDGTVTGAVLEKELTTLETFRDANKTLKEITAETTLSAARDAARLQGASDALRALPKDATPKERAAAITRGMAGATEEEIAAKAEDLGTLTGMSADARGLWRWLTSRMPSTKEYEAQIIERSKDRIDSTLFTRAFEASEREALWPTPAWRMDIERQVGEIDASSPGTAVAGFFNVLKKNPLRGAQYLMEVAVESGVTIGAGLAVGAVTKNPYAAMGTTLATSAPTNTELYFDELIQTYGHDISTKEGRAAFIADPKVLTDLRDKAKAYGITVGFIDAASGGLAGKALVNNPLGNMTLQLLVQGSFGGLSEVMGRLAADEPIDWVEVTLEAIAEVTTAPIEVMAMTKNKVQSTISRISDARRAKTLFDILAGKADTSKLRARDAETFAGAIKHVTENGPIESIYIDPVKMEELFQGENAPMTLEEFFQHMPDLDINAFRTALANGSTFVIPTSAYAAYVAGSEIDASFRAHIKFDPNGLSEFEAKVVADEMKDAATKLEAGAATAESILGELDGPLAAEYDRLVSEVTSAQNVTRAAAERMVAPMVAAARTGASRAKLTTAEYLRRYPLPRVVNPEAVGPAPTRAQITPDMVLDLLTGEYSDAAALPEMSLIVDELDARGIAPEAASRDLVASVIREMQERGDLPGASIEDAALPRTIEDPNAEYMQTATIRNGTESAADWGIDPKKKNKVRDIALKLEARQRKLYGKTARTKRDAKTIAKFGMWMADEIEFELQTPGNAATGWYTDKYAAALTRLGELFPEMNGRASNLPGLAKVKTQDDARALFTAILAVTSNGQKVVDNFKMAVETYAQFRDTGVLEAPSGGSDRAKHTALAFARYQKLLDGATTVTEVRDFLLEELTVSEANKQLVAEGESKMTKVPASMMVPRAATVFGPKLGAFYANLSGSTGYLTMDLWWTRTINRYRGDVLPRVTGLKNEVNSKGRPVGLNRFKHMIGRPELTDRQALNIATDYAQRYALKGWKDGTPAEKAANTLYKQAFVGLAEAPEGAADRAFMIEVSKAARDEVAKRTGVRYSIADIQALIWYYEKRLYADLGARDSGDVSYGEAVDIAIAAHFAAENIPQASTEELTQAPVDSDRLPGLEPASPGRVVGVRELATAYMKANGLPVRHQSTYVSVDKARAAELARLYDEMPHDPTNPEVKAAYEALAAETVAQFEFLQQLGFAFDWIEGEDPYASPADAIRDMQENKHLWVFPTDDGFGTLTEAEADNPLLAYSGHTVAGRKTRINDLFRIVHDVFGHGSEGASFGPRGEENAWQAHVRMFSAAAARAMTTETRGQNSWVNYGPYGESNRANPKETVFADQKTGLLPLWASEDGQAADVERSPADPAELGDFKVKDIDDLSYDAFKRPGWFIMSGALSSLGPATNPENRARAEKLRQDLDAAGLEYLVLEGFYNGEPDGTAFLVIGDEQIGFALGAKYNQESVLTRKGFTYTDGSGRPEVPFDGMVTGWDAKNSDFYSKINGGNPNHLFSLNMVFPKSPDATYKDGDGTSHYGAVVSEDGLIHMVHWSGSPLEMIDPDKAGTGPLPGPERRRNGPRKSFFGINQMKDSGYAQEYGLGDFRHEVAIHPEKMYPWNEDPDGLKAKVNTKYPAQEAGMYEQLIKDAGYEGYFVIGGPLGDAAVTFTAQPVIGVELRRGDETFNQSGREFFTSALLDAISTAKQPKARPAEWLAVLSKVPGLKKVELEWTGVQAILANADPNVSITREELYGFAYDNRVEVDIIEGSGRFSDYTEYLVGGDAEYHEMLITVPNLDQIGPNTQYEIESTIANAGHFRVPNVVVHARYQVTDDVMFIDEVQSDLASNWRKAGGSAGKMSAEQRADAQRYRGATVERRAAHAERQSIIDAVEERVNRVTFELTGAPIGDMYEDFIVVPINVPTDSGTSRAYSGIGVGYVTDRIHAAASNVATGDDNASHAAALIIEDLRQIVHDDLSVRFGRGITNSQFDDMLAQIAAWSRNPVLRDTVRDAIEGAAAASARVNAAYNELIALEQKYGGRPPAQSIRWPLTPFEGEAAVQLATKALLAEAAKLGVKRVAWTPGTMQMERWDVAEQTVAGQIERWSVDRLIDDPLVTFSLNRDGQGFTYVYRLGITRDRRVRGATGPGADAFEGQLIDDVLPAALVRKIDETPFDTFAEGTAEDLESADVAASDKAGEGYRNVYDRQMKKFIEKLGRKFGSDVTVAHDLVFGDRPSGGQMLLDWAAQRGFRFTTRIPSATNEVEYNRWRELYTEVRTAFAKLDVAKEVDDFMDSPQTRMEFFDHLAIMYRRSVAEGLDTDTARMRRWSDTKAELQTRDTQGYDEVALLRHHRNVVAAETEYNEALAAVNLRKRDLEAAAEFKFMSEVLRFLGGMSSPEKLEQVAQFTGLPVSSPLKPVWNLNMSEELRTQLTKNRQPLFQKTGTQTRGSIILPADGSQATVNVFEMPRSDLSTVLHETGHFFLWQLQRQAADGLKHAAVDYHEVLAWWGRNTAAIAKEAGVLETQVKEYLGRNTTGSDSVDRAIHTALHEQFARGFEKYAMTGKAPSNALRTVFESFAAWLLTIYRSALRLNVKIDPSISAVFDRMLATDEELAAGADREAIDNQIAETAKAMGLDEESYRRLVDLSNEARDEGRQIARAEMLKAERQIRSAEYKARLAEIDAEERERVNSKPVNRVIQWLGNGRWLGGQMPEEMPLDLRLDTELLTRDYGADIVGKLPRGRRTLYTNGTGLSADEVAGWFGFPSGADMIEALTSAPNANDEVKASVKARAEAELGDIMGNPGEIEQVVLDAFHGEKRGQVIVAELRAINRLSGGRQKRVTSRAVAAQIARELIARMSVRDALQSHRYQSAERKHAEDAARLLAAGDIEGAFEAKRKQLIQHALYSESRKVTELVEKAERLAGRLKKKTTRENLAKDYLGAIDDILETYSFRRISGKAELRRDRLLGYVKMMNEAGRSNELAIPDHVLKAAAPVPYKTLSVQRLQGVYDTLVNIEHTARWKQKLLDNQTERERMEVIAELRAAAAASVGEADRNRIATRKDRIMSEAAGYFNLVRNADTVLRRLDNWANRGIFYRMFKQRIDAAEVTAIRMRDKATQELKALFDVYSRSEREHMAVRRKWAGYGEAISKWDIISIALNMGNKDNFERLTTKDSKHALKTAEVEALVGTLEKRDWDFVQAVWDHLDREYWPQIAAREERITGAPPKKVEATEVTTKFGTYRGGYYPIVYDSRFTTRVSEDRNHDLMMSMMAGRFGKAQTKNGHTKERAAGGGGRTLELGMHVLFGHVSHVIHDLAFSEAVSDTWALLQDNDVKAIFEEAGRNADHKALELWVQDVAAGPAAGTHALAGLLRTAKSGFTASKLAFNMSTVMLQITGAVQSMAVVGPGNLAAGYGQYLAGGMFTMAQRIKDRSPFMAEREQTFHRDTLDLLRGTQLDPLRSKTSNIAWLVMQAGFWAMQKVQFYSVDAPTWLAAHRQGLAQGMTDEEAALHADRMVARAQASGLYADRSAIERGTLGQTARQNEFLRLFTALGSYMFAKYNVSEEVVGRTMRDIKDPNHSTVMAILKGITDLALVFTAEVILFNLIKGKLPGMGGDDEDESWLWFLTKETALSVFGVFPFIRDLSSAVQGYSGGGAYGGISETIGRAIKSAGDVATGDATMSDMRSFNDALGIMAPGYPSTAIWRIIDGAGATGKEPSPLAMLIGR